MSDHAQLVERFYTAFAAGDPAGMSACYHPEVTFQDPAFGVLKGWRAAAMWHMLTSRSTDLRLEHSAVQADEETGAAHWEAWYTFSATGRSVHNVIDAAFTFQDGRIHTHTDTFSFWRWSRQALGMPGIFLGWSSFLNQKVQRTANAGLEQWIEKHEAGEALIPALD
jgi:ketosteroid isomerase-like protein